MGILDIFKKSAGPAKRPAKTRPVKVKPAEEKVKKVVAEKPLTAAAPAREKKLVLGIIKNPCITEKASLLNELNQYIFEVYPRSNKLLIKKAVESFYNVSVEKVRIINVPARPRRLGRTQGMKSGFKKAVVTLKKGDKIELMPH